MKISKRFQVEELLKQAFILASDIAEFKTYIIQRAIGGVIGNHFASVENRKMLTQYQNPTRTIEAGNEDDVVKLTIDDFTRGFAKKDYFEQLEEEQSKKEKSVPAVNSDKQLVKKNVSELKKHFGDINIFLDHINLERDKLNMELISVGKNWGELKSIFKATIEQKLIKAKKPDKESEKEGDNKSNVEDENN